MEEPIELSAIDELWVALATDGSSALSDLVRLQRKQYAADPDAATLGVPSTGMVAFLLCAGQERLTISAFADAIANDRQARTHLSSADRMLHDKVAGIRRFHVDDVGAIGESAGLSAGRIEDLKRRVREDYPEGDPYCQVPLSTDAVVRALHAAAIKQSVTGVPVVLVGIAAVLRFADEHPDIDPKVVQAEIYGVVTERHNYASGLLLRLTDGLQSIAVLANRHGASFENSKAASVEDRIRVTGVLTRSRHTNELMLQMETCEVLVDSALLPDKRRLLNDLQRRGLPPRILLGTAVHEVCSVLWEAGYIRLEPNIVSSALSDEDTVEALDVYFPGLGARTSLVPSPVPQLIRAGIGLGIPRLYASSRIITRTIRDGFTSPDSPAAFAFLLEAEVERVLSTVEGLLSQVLDRILAPADRATVASKSPWPRVRGQSAEIGSSGHRVSPRQTSARGFDITPFATWVGHNCDIVEGHIAHISPQFGYTIFGIHAERLLQLFRDADAGRLVRFQGPESILVPGVSL